MLIFLILQIISESLPISSSGHIQFFKQLCDFMGWYIEPSSRALEYIAHVFSLPAFLCVLAPRWIVVVKNPLRTAPQWLHLIFYGFCAEFASTLLYFPLQFLGIEQIPLWIGFAISGFLLLSLCGIDTQKPCIPFSYKQAILLGCAQGCAVLPGVSRMGITYIAGRWLGLSARHSFFWSCTLALPIFAIGILSGWLHMSPYEIAFLMHPLTQACLFLAMLGGIVLLYITKKLMFNNRIWYIGWYLFVISMVSWLIA